jgi:Cu2+-exporting ATPase/Cu+-exporting ATPase
MPEQIYKVRGMHCASCASLISKNILKLDGIEKAEVNFATETAQIEFEPDKVSLKKMNQAISKLGYSLSETGQAAAASYIQKHHDDHDHHESADLSRPGILKIKLSLLGALAVFALMVWDILGRLFPVVPELPLSMELWNGANLIIATLIILFVGQPFLQGVIRFARYGAANMDTLIGIGTLSAYLYSVMITIFPNWRQSLGLPEYTYFDVVVVVIGFVTFGKYLEARSKHRTGEAIKKLIGLQAKTALVWREGREQEISISEVKINEIVIVKPGAKIPVDGKIIEGWSSIDESMINGEPIPIDKKPGDEVFGATINKQGSFRFQAAKIGSDTLLAQIIKMVEQAQGSKAPIQALADKISSVFVPIVLVVAVLSLVLWLGLGIPDLGLSKALSYAILCFVGVLVIACPCALGLATPTAIIVGVGKGAENGILVKNAEALQKLSSVNTIVFDKTGTITKGKPEITDLESFDSDWTKEKILQTSAAVEKLSEHPLAQAIVDKAQEQKLILAKPENFAALEGVGVKAVLGNQNVLISKPDEQDKQNPKVKELQAQGKTVVMVRVNNQSVGLIGLSDTLKPEAKQEISRLHKKGIKVVMLTGDNQTAAQYIAGQVKIDEVMAEVLPQDKAGKIQALQQQGKVVAMAGDGINDAPALAQADVGIAMATGTDIAIESAGITLLHGDLQKIYGAIELSRATMKTIKQNLFWAFIYNVVGIPLAAGLFYPIWGIVLNPVFAGMAMAFSSVSVVSNSLRLKTKKI